MKKAPRLVRALGALTCATAMSVGGFAVAVDQQSTPTVTGAVALVSEEMLTYNLGENITVDLGQLIKQEFGYNLPSGVKVSITNLVPGTQFNQSNLTVTGAPTKTGIFEVGGRGELLGFYRDVSFMVKIVDPADAMAPLPVSELPTKQKKQPPYDATPGLAAVQLTKGEYVDFDPWEYLNGQYTDGYQARDKMKFKAYSSTLPAGLAWDYSRQRVVGKPATTGNVVVKIKGEYFAKTGDAPLKQYYYVPLAISAAEKPGKKDSQGSVGMGPLGSQGSLGSLFGS